MGIFDIFAKKKQNLNESNTVLGQLQLGNQVIMGQNRQQPTQQLLYVTTSSTTTAGRVLDMSALTRNSTVMGCVGVKARALSQCGISIMAKNKDGALVDALQKMRIACEVWGETAVSYGHNQMHTTVVKLHDATAQMDIDELMFALANPSMLRRITFSVRELAGCGANHSYGGTIHTEYAVQYGADIRIERLKESYGTMMQNPVEWVVSTIKGMNLV